MLAGRVSTILASLVGVRLITEYVSPGPFGAFSLILGLALLACGILASSLLAGGQRIYADQTTPLDKQLARQQIHNLLRKGQFSVVTLFLLGAGVFLFFQPQQTIWVFIVFSFAIIIETERTLDINLLLISRRQKVVALWQSIELWLRPFLIIGCVLWLSATPTSMAIGHVLSVLIVLLLFRLLPIQLEGTEPSTQHTETPDTEDHTDQARRKELSEQIKRSIVTYTLPLLPLALLGRIHAIGDRYLLGGMLGVKEVGLYVAIYGLLSQALMNVGSVIGLTLYPNFINALRDKNDTLRRRLSWLWPGSVFLLSLTVGCCFLFLQDFILQLILARPYHAGAHLIKWLMPGFIFLNVAISFSQQLYAYSETKLILYGEIFGAIVSLALAVPFIYWMGAKGAALACTLYYFLYLLAQALLLVIARKRWERKEATTNDTETKE